MTLQDENEKNTMIRGGEGGQMEISFPPTEDEKEQEAVIEAVLFTMGKAVELEKLALAIGQDQETARQAVERLKERYEKDKRGMEIVQLEDSYQMCTRTGFYENLIREKSGRPASPEIHFLLEMYCNSSIYMTVKWVTGEVTCTPEELAERLMDGMPGKLAEVFTGLGILN